MIRTQFNLEEEQYHYLQQLAARKNQSLSGAVRAVIDTHRKGKKRKTAGEILLELADNAVSWKKVNPSVPDDVIENMNEYLYGSKSPKWGHLWKTSRRKK